MAEQLKPPSKKQQSQQSSERRKQIALIVLMVAGLFTMLAIFSYAKHDEAITGNLSFFDVFRVLFNDHVKAQAEQIENRFGLLGALIADVFVNDTIGYFSLSIPILVIMWAWVILRKKEIRNLVTVTNYALVGGILASSTMGIAGLLFGLSKEWSGLIGAFAAAFLTKLLGSVGASIFALTALCVTTILAIDLDVHKSIERVSSLWRALVERYRQRGELQPATAEVQLARLYLRVGNPAAAATLRWWIAFRGVQRPRSAEVRLALRARGKWDHHCRHQRRQEHTLHHTLPSSSLSNRARESNVGASPART